MKQKFIMLPCIAAVAIASVVGKKILESHANETSNLLMQNVEALSKGTDSQDDCHYSNGYTSFTNKKGGAYDCCKVWVSQAPGNEHCR